MTIYESISFLGCLAAMNDGLLYAWSSPFIVKITNDNETYNISEYEASYFATIPTISMMVFCIVFSLLSDFIGRKTTLLIIAIPAIISWLLKAFATNIALFYLARIFVGIHMGCFFAVLPVYVGEISSPNVRGMLGSLVSSINFVGQCLINIIGNNLSVSTTSFICLPLPVVFFVLFIFMPESPYFYVMKGRNEEAKISLRRLKNKENVDEDFVKLKSDVDRQLSETGTWKDLVTIKSNRKALLIGVFLRTSQFVGGISVFISSIQFIFEKSSGIIPSGTAAMIYSFLTCVFFICAGCFIDKMGRRLAYTSSLILTSIVLLLESLYFYLSEFHPELNLSALSWFPLIGQIVYIMFASFGPGIVPTIMTGEIFSTSIKAKANIVMVFTVAFMVSVSNLLFFRMYSTTGLCGPFLLFSILNILCSIISHFYLPETKCKTLEEIQQILKGNNIR